MEIYIAYRLQKLISDIVNPIISVFVEDNNVILDPPISIIDNTSAITPEDFAQNTDEILCRFASLSYEKDRGKIRSELSKPKYAGWILLTTGSNEFDGYRGAAFWHQRHRQLVIAHKGTDFKDLRDHATDGTSIVLGQYTSQIHSARTFASLVLHEFDNIDCRVAITGHSLGGWLAQVAAYAANREQRINPYIVTFDSPGCYEMLSKLSEKCYGDDNFSFPLDVTNYCIIPNLVNITNSHVGKILSFSPIVEILRIVGNGQGSILEDLLLTAVSHPIQRFITALENDAPRYSYNAEAWPKFSFLRGLINLVPFAGAPTTFMNLMTLMNRRLW